MQPLFDFDDILIQPAVISTINSRADINPYTSYNNHSFLPLITAPMDTVINEKNQSIFKKNKIITTSVRKSDWQLQYDLDSFQAISLQQLQYLIKKKLKLKQPVKILVDIANGHMQSLLDSIKHAKNIYGTNLILMVGNIANPSTFVELSTAGADYVRVGIGGGSGCLTTVHTAIGYPMGSLIKECRILKRQNNCSAKIVADGGMKNYSDIIKSLALGADFVMVGSIFNKALESAGKTFIQQNRIDDIKIVDQFSTKTKKMFNEGIGLYKNFRGMSTKEAQKAMGSKKIKTSEGVNRIYKVEYTLAGWVENFEHYLRSAMSYTNSPKLENFIGNVSYNIITGKAFERTSK